jgi:hypothetical protein
VLWVVINSVVSLACGYLLLSMFGSADAAFNFGVEKLLAVPLGCVLFGVIHGLWVWATAGRQIYYELQSEIKSLRNEVSGLKVRSDKASSLEIVFDSKQHKQADGDGACECLLYRIGVRCHGDSPVEGAKVQIVQITAKGRKLLARGKHEVGKLRGLCIKAKHSRSPHEDSFVIHPGRELEFDVVSELRVPGPPLPRPRSDEFFVIRHTVEDMPPDPNIPVGNYDMTIAVTGTCGSQSVRCEQSFRISRRRGRLTFRKLNQSEN